MKKIGIYVHIPFCNSICPYCDFYSVVEDTAVKEKYVEAVIASIENCPLDNLQGNTLYFGGGTPTALPASSLIEIKEAVAKKFELEGSTEITLEANPESADLETLTSLRKAGFNRVSFGVQSSNEKELKALGRIHSIEDAVLAIENAEKAGFSNISVDIMLGIPYQTKETALQSVEFLTKLPVNHISAYMLSIEEGTPFEEQGMIKHCMSDEKLGETYLAVVNKLEQAGFNQYEISNFAKNGGESKHNLKYWLCEEYLGFGASAHSFFEEKRFSFPSDINEIIDKNGNWSLINQDSGGGDFAEYGMLHLRLKRGLDLDEYEKLYPQVNKESILEMAEELKREGYMNIEGNRIFFTPEGFLLSNYFIAQLLF